MRRGARVSVQSSSGIGRGGRDGVRDAHPRPCSAFESSRIVSSERSSRSVTRAESAGLSPPHGDGVRRLCCRVRRRRCVVHDGRARTAVARSGALRCGRVSAPSLAAARNAEADVTADSDVGPGRPPVEAGEHDRASHGASAPSMHSCRGPADVPRDADGDMSPDGNLSRFQDGDIPPLALVQPGSRGRPFSVDMIDALGQPAPTTWRAPAGLVSRAHHAIADSRPWRGPHSTRQPRRGSEASAPMRRTGRKRLALEAAPHPPSRASRLMGCASIG